VDSDDDSRGISKPDGRCRKVNDIDSVFFDLLGKNPVRPVQRMNGGRQLDRFDMGGKVFEFRYRVGRIESVSIVGVRMSQGGDEFSDIDFESSAVLADHSDIDPDDLRGGWMGRLARHEQIVTAPVG
jgi:hypothetical protein